MTTTVEIAEILVNAGFLSEKDIQAAVALLEKTLETGDTEARLAAAIRDEADQENMIAGARDMTEQDAAIGDKKDLKVDRAILQDALNQEQVDESIVRGAEKKITRAYHAAAAALAKAGLIDKRHRQEVAELRADEWGAGEA